MDMNYLSKNALLYAGLIQVINRNTAQILEKSEQGIFLRDTVGNACMLATENEELGLHWLKAHEDLKYDLLVVFQHSLVEYAKKQYGLNSEMDCFQAVYTQPNPPVLNGSIQIREATPKDIWMFAEHYQFFDEEEISYLIQHGELFVGEQDGKTVGFVGQHLEGSMGLLEIFPEFQGKDYGTELEKHMIIRMLEKGQIPFCQVDVNNFKSLKLQKKLGLSISKEHMYWVY
jgi:ribosomal protein S18 acetylase RimI-like enzyme